MSDDTPVTVPTIVEQPADFTVVANNPSDMVSAQRSLILWCARKIQFMKSEIAEAAEQLSISKEKKWNTDAWRREVSKREKRAEFYRKIKAALEAGYYIVPPFPVDVFAIRVDRHAPHRYDSIHKDNHDQPAQVLSIGKGRYVDPKPTRHSYADRVTTKDGQSKDVTHWYADDYRDVDFPFKLARSEVKDATLAAMQLKVFDRMGVLPRVRKPDPIVCGQVLYPNQQIHRWGQPNAVTFFVAWWLDTRTL